MRDFTLDTFRQLLLTLKERNYTFLSFAGFLKNPVPKCIILRHDVDARKMNSLQTARLEKGLGITGTYNFRIVTESFDTEIIKEIADLGHEIGYHYEDVSYTAQRHRGAMAQRLRSLTANCDKKNPLRALLTGAFMRRRALLTGAFMRRRGGGRGGIFGSGLRAQSSGQNEEEVVNIAIQSFKENLKKLRRIVPVKTICMHGSPLSRWDNRLLWKYYDYREFGITGEPYFDIDFNEVLYLTDTGRRWDGESVSIRDKAQSSECRAQSKEGLRDSDTQGQINEERKTLNLQPETWNLKPGTSLKFHSTFDIIKAAKENKLPDKIMLTIHPQRWDDRMLPWIRELVWQNIKNTCKWLINR